MIFSFHFFMKFIQSNSSHYKIITIYIVVHFTYLIETLIYGMFIGIDTVGGCMVK